MKISEIDTWEDLREALMSWMFLIALGWFCGWVHAHSTVARECERLGGFYVGKTNYRCTPAQQPTNGADKAGVSE